MPDRDARSRGDDPADVLVGAIPHLDSEGQAGWDVVQVWIREFAQQLVETGIRVRRCAPKCFALGA